MFRSILCISLLILSAGCASTFTPQCKLDPLTGQVSCGVGIHVEGAQGVAEISGTVTPASRAIDQCGNRSIDPCGNRSVSYASIDRPATAVYWRGLLPYQTATARGFSDTRGLIEMQRNLAIGSKAVERDLKRELHNAKVMRDYSSDVSMKSAIRGWFGWERKLCPLNPALQPSPIVEVQTAEVITTPAMPSVDPGFGDIPPTEKRGDTLTNRELQKRVESLEGRVGSFEYKLDAMQKENTASKNEILSAIAALKKP